MKEFGRFQLGERYGDGGAAQHVPIRARPWWSARLMATARKEKTPDPCQLVQLVNEIVGYGIALVDTRLAGEEFAGGMVPWHSLIAWPAPKLLV